MKPTIKTLTILTLALLVGCDIVELEDENNVITDDVQDISSSQVNLGDGTLPGDANTLGQLLHNNDSKTWVASEFTIEGLSTFLGCRLDDTITLFSDGTYSYDGGENLCGADDDQRVRSGNWTFNFDTSELIFEPGTSAETSATIVTLDNDILTFTGIYQSTLFGSFDVEGRYAAN